MTWPNIIVGGVAIAVVVWVLLFTGCGVPPLPPEPPFTETVASNRDR